MTFSIGTTIKGELDDFFSSTLELTRPGKPNETGRYLLGKGGSYRYNQYELLCLIDMYHASQFESGELDENGNRKLFLNIGKFRCEVASKQVDIDSKDFRFIPDDYSNPYTAIFMQKEFAEWVKETYFGAVINGCVETYPKYGSVVTKKVGNEIVNVPLKSLRNEQSCETLQKAKYVIEEHPYMYKWEIEEYKSWDTKGINLEPDKSICVYERYGYVPKSWLKTYSDVEYTDGDEEWVDAVVICTFDVGDDKVVKNEHIFFASEINKRPYEEEHWSRQWGRWLGVGVWEDLIENQIAQNTIANLYRRSLQWSSTRAFQSTTTDLSAKNLLADVQDGDIIEVGPSGQISQVDLANRSTGEYEQIMRMWTDNANQKAFTYEVSTGEALPSGTPFRLGVLLNDAVNSYFALKREKLGMFLKKSIESFLIPQFMRDMGKKSRVIAFFHDEPGYEVLKQAAVSYLKGETIRAMLLSGEVVDVAALTEAVDPVQAVDKLFFDLSADFYKEAKYKFTLSVTGEEIDLPTKLTTLSTIWQALQAKGDPRAEDLLQRIAGLTGESIPNIMATQNMAPMPQASGSAAPLNLPQSRPSTENQ